VRFRSSLTGVAVRWEREEKECTALKEEAGVARAARRASWKGVFDCRNDGFFMVARLPDFLSLDPQAPCRYQ